MRLFVAALLTLGATTAWARQVPLLVGGYTDAPGQGITLYRFDEATGQISKAALQVSPASNPSWLVLAADHRHLYAVHENGPASPDPVGRVSAWQVNPASGRITPVNRVLALGNEPTYASISRDGGYLFVADYGGNGDPPGALVVLPIARDGRLRAAVQVKTGRASQADPARQMAPHAHSAVSSPDGRFVFVQDLGADRIHVYRHDPAHREAPLQALADQPEVVLPPGSGPRHLVFSPDGRHAWATLEMAGAIAAFDHDAGHLTLRSIVPLAPADFHGRMSAAALHVSPDGRFLLATDRGTDNSLVSFAIDPASGALHPVDRHPTGGTEPREFVISRDGRFVLVANQRSDRIAVLARDPATGVIGATVQTLAVHQPSSLVFVSR
jgi:6-phosphogluconolactonase (cycloisomerase 2 family)